MITPSKRRNIIIWIIVIILLIISWVISLFLPTRSLDVIPAEYEEVTSQPTVNEESLPETAMQKEQAVRNGSSDIISLSKVFVERYGSYSNESDFANIKDVLPIMSEAFANRSQSFIDNNVAPEEYYGVTTRVISVKADDIDDGSEVGSAIITTQKEETKDSPQNSEVRYQEIELEFVKEAGVWKVDSANWL